MILRNYFENPEVLHMGTCPNRSYYIPCSTVEQAIAERPRFASDRVQMLNGTWKFKYHASVYDLVGTPWEETNLSA